MKIFSVEFKANGETLRGKICLAEKPKKIALLFIHGWTGKPNEAASRALANNGFMSMTFSLSGHNDSSGKLEDQTRQKSQNEILAAYDLFKSRLPAGTKIGVLGNSYGGYFAALLPSLRPVACLSLRVPANYPDNGFAGPVRGHQFADIMEWREKKLSTSETKSLRAVHDFKGKVQIIEAENDDAIPHQSILNYINAISDKNQLDYHFMKGWPHSLGDDGIRNQQYQSILLNWLAQQV